MSSSSSPCAACKLQRRKCTPECVFAPYFPPDHPQKFATVHKIFGASNVQKLLTELPTAHREDAVNSLAFEADARLKDPVNGCSPHITYLQNKLKKIEEDLNIARKELAGYIGPAALFPMVQASAVAGGYMPSQALGNGLAYNMPMMGMHGRQLVIRDPQQHEHQLQQQLQMYEAQHNLALALKEQQEDVKRVLVQHQNMQRQQHSQEGDLLSFDGGFNGSSVMSQNDVSQAIGSFSNLNMNSPQLENMQQDQLQAQLLLMHQPKHDPQEYQEPQQPHEQYSRDGS